MFAVFVNTIGIILGSLAGCCFRRGISKEMNYVLMQALGLCAVSEGIVVGGGACLVKAYVALKDEVKSDVVDVQKGIKVVFDALLAPITQIADNAGYNSEEIVERQKAAEENVGFDAKNGKWVDMIESGIIDPTKVTRNALMNASSISALFLTTEAGVAKIDKDEPAPAMPQGMY